MSDFSNSSTEQSSDQDQSETPSIFDVDLPDVRIEWTRAAPFNDPGTYNNGLDCRVPFLDDGRLKDMEALFAQLVRPSKTLTQFQAVPLALNLFNNRNMEVCRRGTWVYTYPTIVDPKVIKDNHDLDEIPDDVLRDMNAPWVSVETNPNRHSPYFHPRYRFMVVIFQHKEPGRSNSSSERKRFVFSMVYFDREHTELHWHDTGVDPYRQEERWRDVRNWWSHLNLAGFIRQFAPRMRLFGHAVQVDNIRWHMARARFPNTPENQLCHEEFQRMLDGARTKMGMRGGQIYWSLSLYAVMCWVMHLAVHTVSERAPFRPRFPRNCRLVAGVQRDTMPTLIVLMYKVLYHHRAQKRTLERIFANEPSCREQYSINDNISLNRAVNAVMERETDLSGNLIIPPVPFDALTNVFPWRTGV
ncbi:hypothetical protein GGR52DRAFT_566694 [Hypoxylon sp. FL1284]|nr:hypothetical protein GGR52DRAFT_566694 [Hypoxylon sp. FL1284]